MTEKLSEIITIKTGTVSCLDDRDDVLRQEIERQRAEAKQKQAERLWERSNVGKRFKDVTLNGFTGDPEALKACRKWVDNLQDGEGLVLCGSYGVGKTHLATATAREAMERYGITVWFSTFAGILQELKGTYGNSKEFNETLQKYRIVDLLVIDDLGKENLTAWASEMLFTVIDERYRNMKAVIITTNMMPKELGQHIDEAIMSRLAEMCTFVRVTGDDYRLRRKK